MTVPVIKTTQYHGSAGLGLSRYIVMCLGQLGWVALGAYLLRNAYWPTSCRPDGLISVFTCSFRLPESRHWIEAALLTWLWATPILVLLEASRRYRSWIAARALSTPLERRR